MARKRDQHVVIGLDQLEKDLQRVLKAASGLQQAAALLDAVEEIVVPDAKQRAQRGGTNELSESIEAEIQSTTETDASVAAGTNLFYGPFVELGVRAHSIKPKNKEALRIGNNVRASAEHPGTRPDPFLRPAADENRDAITQHVASGLRKGVEQAAKGR